MQNYTNTNLLNLKGVESTIIVFEGFNTRRLAYVRFSFFSEETLCLASLSKHFYDVLDASSKEEARQALDK